MPCLKPSLEQDGNLGPDAARARNRRSLSAARCAGCGGIGKTLESPKFRRFRRCTGRLNATQPGVLAVSPLYIRGLAACVQGKRRCAATLRLIRRNSLKLRLTLWFYCGKRAARRHGFVGEPRKSSCFAGMRAIVRCSIAVFRRTAGAGAAEAQSSNPPSNPTAASNFPIASDARLAGDAKQTRFVLDLDKTIQFRAFALADPYRVVVDIPQVSFQLPADSRHHRARADQGIPLWPGHAGRLADRVRSDRPGQDRKILCAGCGQRPAAAAGA